jgi:hypothetical protein
LTDLRNMAVIAGVVFFAVIQVLTMAVTMSKVQTKMDQRAGGHQWPFDGSKCLACGMTPTRFADTKEACSGQPLEREGFTVPDDDE